MVLRAKEDLHSTIVLAGDPCWTGKLYLRLNSANPQAGVEKAGDAGDFFLGNLVVVATKA
jgi:hypothetical protein